VFATAVVLSRQMFYGDGIRQLVPVMTMSTPGLGEARWLLFPAFLFVLLRPLYSLGLFHTVESGLRVFGIASVLASLLYLGALRSWLIRDEVPTGRRWIALALAALCPSFLLLATDTAEPLFGAALSAVGLAVIARTQRLPLGILFMSLGLLLHQTVFVAFFLLPMATTWQRLRDVRELGRSAAIVGSVVAVILGILMVANHVTLGNALGRIFLVYRNSVHMNWMRGGILKGVVVTVFGGFPQALVNVPGMNGMRAIISGLRHGEAAAIGQAFRLAVGLALVAAGAYVAYRRRRWEWFVALAGFSILPIIWNNLYGYVKFYVLFPLLAAHVIARVSPRVAVPIVGLLALLNLSAVGQGVATGREKAGARKAQYLAADANTRWITSAWEPDLPFLWPGRYCGMLRAFGRPSNATTEEALRAERTGEFTDCVREAFCSTQPVWTDDWIVANGPAIAEIARFHGLATSFLDRTFWRSPSDGKAVDTNPVHSLFVYSPERAAQICADLSAVRP
jgi:hypothetical protein